MFVCMAQVKARRGVISSLALNNGIWDINQGLLTADRVFLATGSHPRDDQLYPGPTVVPLDDALIPSKLSGTACGCMQVMHATNRTQTSWITDSQLCASLLDVGIK